MSTETEDHPKPRRGRGRPTYQPTDKDRKQVEAFVTYGASCDEIAKLMELSPKTLRKHFRPELDGGKLKANMKVAESLFLQAIGSPAVYDEGGNELRKEQPRVLGAAIFWAKTQMGWSEYRPLRPPEPLKPGRKGKKDLAREGARTAEGTDWATVLEGGTPN